MLRYLKVVRLLRKATWHATHAQENVYIRYVRSYHTAMLRCAKVRT